MPSAYLLPGPRKANKSKPPKETDSISPSELETECKITACLEKFLRDVNSNSPNPTPKRSSWFTPERNNGYMNADSELFDNLDRLVPGYLGSEGWSMDLQARSVALMVGLRGELSGGDVEKGRYSSSDISHALLLSAAEEIQQEQQKGKQRALPEGISRVEHEKPTLFACGGEIPISRRKGRAPQGTKSTPSLPVGVIWATNKGQSPPEGVILPLHPRYNISKKQLLEDCLSPSVESSRMRERIAGLPGGEEHGQLSADEFVTTFRVGDFGIIGAIEEALLSGVPGREDVPVYVRAALSHLSIYDPTSKVSPRKTEKIPDRKNYLGTLVVCLPSAFEGGSLVVQQGEDDVEFDWARQSPNTIQWAAFYSTCEQKLSPVTRGYRGTLTYNLYTNRPINIFKLSGHSPPSPPSNEPFKYEHIPELMNQPDFLPHGGIIGISCPERYASTTSGTLNAAYNLKHRNLVAYSILRSQNLAIDVLPIIQSDETWYILRKGLLEKHRESNEPVRRGFSLLRPSSWRISPGPRSNDNNEVDSTCWDNVDKRWKLLYMNKATSRLPEPTDPQALAAAGLITKEKEALLSLEADENWPAYPLPNITWLSESDDAVGDLKGEGWVGNTVRYWLCSGIFALVPPFKERMGIAEDWRCPRDNEGIELRTE